MNFDRRPIFWTLFSLAFVAGNFFLFRAFLAPHIKDMHELVILLSEKGIIAFLLAGIFTISGGWRAAGFVKPRGRFWLLMGGPIWIGIIGAAPGGAMFVLKEPLLAFAYGAVALLVAFGEEGVFRGVMLKALERRSIWAAALISSFLFGAVHLLALSHAPPELVVFFIGQAGVAMAIGLLMAGLTFRYHSILPAVFFHFLLDAMQFWNAGGVGAAVKKTLESLSDYQIAAGIVIGMVLFGGWGAFLTAGAAKKARLNPTGNG